jgi:serine/threonine-protein kinase
MESSPQGKIGRYVIQGELGRGAMGVVYRAQDPAIGRTVAIKTIRIGQFHDEREIRHVQTRMMREAQAAGVLSHNNIVTIYDILQEDDTAFIFMEFVDGQTLEKILLADTPIDKQLILHILKQSAEALDYAHQRGIVHRDVKPANIMVSRDGTAKIADFGIARTQSQSLTQTGQLLGTPNYMSPEQISGKPVDGRADQYSLAVILYEVLTGEKPFVADSLPTLLFRVVSEMPQPAPRLNPTLSPDIDDVLQKALAKSPEDRYPTCMEFMRALERACQSAPGWTTLPRGAGLSQPTSAGAPVQPAPKPFAVSSQETVPAKTIPPAPTPARPSPAAAAEPEKPKFNMAAICAVALVAAAIGGSAVVWKLQNDRDQPSESPAAPPAAPAAAELPKPVATQQPAATPPPPPPTVPAPATPSPKPADTPKPTSPSPSGPAPASVMAVAIRTTPEGASVVIDEGKLPPCSSPCLVELPHGRHTATISMDTYRSEFRIFYVPQDSAVNVTMEKRKGTIEVNSTPPGATVTIDGVEQGQKTPARFPLVVGKHTVTVSMPGRTPYTQTFEMRSEATISLHPNWAN